MDVDSARLLHDASPARRNAPLLAAFSRLDRSTCREHAFTPSSCENTAINGASPRSPRTVVKKPGWPIVIVIVALVVIRSVMAPSRHDGGGKTAEEILKERFARGEIDTEEYTTRLSELRK